MGEGKARIIPAGSTTQENHPSGGFFVCERRNRELDPAFVVRRVQRSAGTPITTAEGCPKGEGHGWPECIPAGIQKPNNSYFFGGIRL